MTSRRIIEVVGAAIIDTEGRILAARRGPEMALSGKWEFPGGKVEKGESHEECLRREIDEELGVDVVVQEFVARGTSTTERGDVVHLDVYTCAVEEGEPTPIEHDKLVWLAPSQLGTLDWAEADIAAVDRLSKR